MGILTSKIDTTSSEFADNARALQGNLERFKELMQSVESPPPDRQIERHRARAKLLARDRVNLLIDPGSPFLEIGALAGHEVYGDMRPGAAMICGVGRLHGRDCMIVANDATVKGGTYFPLTVKKHLRAQEIALENRLPCIYLVDSGGAFLPMQDEVFPDRDHFGRIFYNQARMSSLGIAQVAVVMGSCTAGGAYVPAMSDQAIIVRNQGTIFLGGPPLVKAATGEEISAEDLGGASVHSKISGVTDYLAESDQHALEITRTVIANLAERMESGLRRETPTLPRYQANEIYGLIPSDPKKHFPMREILARILDDSNLDEFKKEYGETLICGFCKIDGYLVGLIANDGILFSESALKAVHFIQLCNQRGIPLLFVHNIVGFMVGGAYERGGIAKDGAKMVNAVACSVVPKISLIVGGSFGAGNYGMAGRAYQPRFLFTWPNSRVAVMGPDQAASVLTQVKRDGVQRDGGSWPADDEEKYRQGILGTYSRQSNALYGTARLWDDGIIDPAETRTVLSLSLNATSRTPLPSPSYGVFRT